MVSPTGEITLDANIDRSDNGDVCMSAVLFVVKDSVLLRFNEILLLSSQMQATLKDKSKVRGDF